MQTDAADHSEERGSSLKNQDFSVSISHSETSPFRAVDGGGILGEQIPSTPMLCITDN